MMNFEFRVAHVMEDGTVDVQGEWHDVPPGIMRRQLREAFPVLVGENDRIADALMVVHQPNMLEHMPHINHFRYEYRWRP